MLINRGTKAIICLLQYYFYLLFLFFKKSFLYTDCLLFVCIDSYTSYNYQPKFFAKSDSGLFRISYNSRIWKYLITWIHLCRRVCPLNYLRWHNLRMHVLCRTSIRIIKYLSYEWDDLLLDYIGSNFGYLIFIVKPIRYNSLDL